MTADTFRTIALTLPGAMEAAHMHHPDFRVNGKIFASLGYPGEDWGMVKLTPDQQRSFVQKAPEVFRPCKGVWGRQGSTNVHLPKATKAVASSALKTAFENVGGSPDDRRSAGL